MAYAGTLGWWYNPHDLHEEKFCERVAELTAGSLKITPFAGGQIVPSAQAFDADDVAKARSQAVQSWKNATDGDVHATRMMESQVTLMKELRLF